MADRDKDLLASLQRVLLGKIVPAIRAVSAEFRGTQLILRTTWDRRPSLHDDLVLAGLGSDLAAEFSGHEMTELKQDVVVVPAPDVMEHLACLAFERHQHTEICAAFELTS